MDVELTLDRSGGSKAGVDYGALEDNLQAEIDKLAAQDNVTSGAPERSAAPDGAQGDHAMIQWLVHLATEPAMAKTYANALVFALNEIVGAVRSRQTATEEGTSAGDEPPARLHVRLAKLGKNITLPTTTAAIQAFLEGVGDA